MLHPPGFGAERPIDVPILIAADGRKGLAVAGELGDGVFSAAVPQPDATKVADWRALLSFGTVLDDGEDLTSARVIDAAGPAAVVLYHAMYERGGAAPGAALPGGEGGRGGKPAPPPTGRALAGAHGQPVQTHPPSQPPPRC